MGELVGETILGPARGARKAPLGSGCLTWAAVAVGQYTFGTVATK